MNIPVHRYAHTHTGEPLEELTVVLGVGEYANEGEADALVTIEVYSHPVDPDANPADYVEQAVAAVRGALAGPIDTHAYCTVHESTTELCVDLAGVDVAPTECDGAWLDDEDDEGESVRPCVFVPMYITRPEIDRLNRIGKAG